MAPETLFFRLRRILSNARTEESAPVFDDETPELELNVPLQAPISDLEKRFCELLEVPTSSSIREKRQAYRKLCLRYHPDNFSGDDIKLKAASELMIQLNQAIDYFEKEAR
jgi:DnaJ-domain-containing protein 1